MKTFEEPIVDVFMVETEVITSNPDMGGGVDGSTLIPE